MKMILLKLIYICRKKVQHVLNWYLELEIKTLHNNRIKISDNFYFTQFPVFNFDQSNSSILLKANVSIRGCVNFNFFDDGNIEIGENTFFNGGCSISSLKQIVIGRNCLIGENVKMYDHNHNYKSDKILIKDQGYTFGAIEIGDNCWVGSNVTILKGVTIGNNCVIGSNCLVVKSLAANSIMYSDIRSQVVKSIDVE